MKTAGAVKPRGGWFLKWCSWIWGGCCYLAMAAEVGLVVGLWLLLAWFHAMPDDYDRVGWLSPPKSSFPFREAPDATLNTGRTLASGEQIVLNNYRARFRGDLKRDNQAADRLFRDFASALVYAREREMDVLPSAGMIQFCLKREDDRLLETLQLEMQADLVELLGDLAENLRERHRTGSAHAEPALAMAAAASELAGEPLEGLGDDVERAAARLIAAFEAGWLNLAPRGMDEAKVAERYARDPELARLFKSQRFLMQCLSPEAAEELVAVFRGNAELRGRLEAIDRMIDISDNPPELRHLGEMLDDRLTSLPAISFLAWADSPENRYYAQLYGRGFMPSGRSWMGDIIEGLRSGAMEYELREDSGWYDYKFRALVPLVREQESYSRRSGKVEATSEYEGFLQESFRAALMGLRETHVLRVGSPPKGIGGPGAARTGYVELAPEFTCQPEPSFYWHLSRAYGFLAGRLGPDDESGRRAAELEGITRDLAALSLLELGLPADGLTFNEKRMDEGLEGWPENPNEKLQEGAARARRWINEMMRSSVLSDNPCFLIDSPDGRRWGVAGVRLARIEYEFEAMPDIIDEGTTTPTRFVLPRKANYLAPLLLPVEVAEPIAAEEFASFCGRFTSARECLDALGSDDTLYPAKPIPWWLPPALVSLLAALHIRWWGRIVWRRWRGRDRLSLKQRTGRRVAWGVASVLFMLYVPLFLVCHIGPRMDLPPKQRMLWCAVFTSVFSRWVEPVEIVAEEYLFLPGRAAILLSPRQIVGWGLKSDNRAVRHVALNSMNFGEWGPPPPSLIGGLIDICRERGQSEAKIAFEWLTVAANDRRRGTSESTTSRIHQAIRETYRTRPDPSFVLHSAELIRDHGTPADMEKLLATLKSAAQAGTISDIYALTFAIPVGLSEREDPLPYDGMIELGFFPEDPTAIHEIGFGGPGVFWNPAIEGFLDRLQEMQGRLSRRERFDRTGNDYDEVPIDDETKKRYLLARDDLRPAQLWLEQHLYQAPIAGFDVFRGLHVFSPRQKDWIYLEFAARMHDWPEEHIDRWINSRTIDDFLGRAPDSTYDDDPGEAYYQAIEQLCDSPWYDRPNLSYHPHSDYGFSSFKTYGEILEQILYDRDHPPAPPPDSDSLGAWETWDDWGSFDPIDRAQGSTAGEPAAAPDQ